MPQYPFQPFVVIWFVPCEKQCEKQQWNDSVHSTLWHVGGKIENDQQKMKSLQFEKQHQKNWQIIDVKHPIMLKLEPFDYSRSSLVALHPTSTLW